MIKLYFVSVFFVFVDVCMFIGSEYFGKYFTFLCFSFNVFASFLFCINIMMFKFVLFFVNSVVIVVLKFLLFMIVIFFEFCSTFSSFACAFFMNVV